MTELETLQRAKMYLDKLAIGINPLNDTAVGAEDVVNQVRISKCLMYVSDVLNRVIEQGGVTAPADGRAGKKRSKKEAREAKKPFSLTAGQRGAFVPDPKPISITTLARNVNGLAADKGQGDLSYTALWDWALKKQLLYANARRDGTYRFVPSDRGRAMGISQEVRETGNGPIEVLLYDENAQRYLVDHLDEILEYQAGCTVRQKEKWSREEEDRLVELFAQATALTRISEILQRDTQSIRKRLKKIRKDPDGIEG